MGGQAAWPRLRGGAAPAGCEGAWAFRGRPDPGIGDAVRTDIAGAVGFGIDSIIVARGIHADLRVGEVPLLLPHVQDWIEAKGRAARRGVMNLLTWE